MPAASGAPLRWGSAAARTSSGRPRQAPKKECPAAAANGGSLVLIGSLTLSGNLSRLQGPPPGLAPGRSGVLKSPPRPSRSSVGRQQYAYPPTIQPRETARCLLQLPLADAAARTIHGCAAVRILVKRKRRGEQTRAAHHPPRPSLAGGGGVESMMKDEQFPAPNEQHACAPRRQAYRRTAPAAPATPAIAPSPGAARFRKLRRNPYRTTEDFFQFIGKNCEFFMVKSKFRVNYSPQRGPPTTATPPHRGGGEDLRPEGGRLRRPYLGVLPQILEHGLK